jgi:hypothetical protein
MLYLVLVSLFFFLAQTSPCRACPCRPFDDPAALQNRMRWRYCRLLITNDVPLLPRRK